MPHSHRLSSLLCRAILLLWTAALPLQLLAAASSPQELLAAGRVDDALRLLLPLATGNNAEAYNYLGRVYYSMGEWDDAVRNCERAAQLAPGNAEFHLWMGRSYGEKANVSTPLTAYSLARKTVAAFELAHSLDRRSIPIARDLGEYYATAPGVVGGGSGKALALADEMAKEAPSLAAWFRAMAASHEGNYEEAERQYQESIRLEGDSADTQLELARFLRGRKQWKRFQSTVEHALRSPRIRPEDRYDAAELLLRTNRNLPEAARQMRMYIQSGHPVEDAPMFRAHAILGDILLKIGDTTQATAEYRAALALADNYRPAANALHRLGQR
jgi:tetratricopeptide (TPR) repeat protein